MRFLFLFAFLMVWGGPSLFADTYRFCRKDIDLETGESCCKLNHEIPSSCRASSDVAVLRSEDCRVLPGGSKYYKWTCWPSGLWQLRSTLGYKKKYKSKKWYRTLIGILDQHERITDLLPFCKNLSKLNEEIDLFENEAFLILRVGSFRERNIKNALAEFEKDLPDFKKRVTAEIEKCERLSSLEGISKDFGKIQVPEGNDERSVELRQDLHAGYIASSGRWFLNCSVQVPMSHCSYCGGTCFTRKNQEKMDKNPLLNTKCISGNYEAIKQELDQIFNDYGLEFNFPEQVTFSLPKNVVPRKINGADDIKYVSDWLGRHSLLSSENKEVVYLDEGSSSVAFKFRDVGNAEKVAKFLNDKRSEAYLKAEMARGQTLKQLTEHFKVGGEGGTGTTFLDVELPDMKYAQQGVLIQQYLDGPTAYEIGKLVYSTKEDAQAEHQLAEFGFLLKEAQGSLKILETFYQVSFGIGYKVSQEISDFSPRNFVVLGAYFSSETGYDYQHGRNVKWDKRRRIWVIFDY